MTWAPWSSHGVTEKVERCSVGPGPRDDMFFLAFLFFIVIPAQAGIHCAAGICVA